MSPVLMPLLVAVLPVLAFLGGLVLFDSYKLVRVRTVLAVLVGGAAAAGAAYLLHGALLGRTEMTLRDFSHWVSPFTEELLKGLVVLALIRARRIGFLVDAAILGFAVGAGFATLENAHFVRLVPDASMTTWVVRGFGTALMHGGATASLAVLALSLIERRPQAGAFALVPGWMVAALLHGVFNRWGGAPQVATLATLVAVPAVLLAVFHHSERLTAAWLGAGFDADAQRLAALHSGQFADSPAGRYLATLKRSFDGPVVADVLCYLRLHTELAMRAKGLLMLRENGLPVPALDDATRSSLDELRYLEKSIGRAGLRALRPLLPLSLKDLRQIHLLGAG
ncbi:MAG TPA: PrsW family glutamic-type intramembrane protease [Burkholderiaceae bacterium]|nr:PrsW family glutamic-type intramembrane protease [Burkholderiaceae bacterium]